MKVSGQLHEPAALPSEEDQKCLLDGPKIRFRQRGEKLSCFYQEPKPIRPTRSTSQLSRRLKLSI
jgi:hypothetical protein